MLPFIEPGNNVYMESPSIQEYRRGDIICFSHEPPVFFAHRFVYRAMKNGLSYFIEKGDNVYGYSFVATNRIVGRLYKIERARKTIDLHSRYWRTINGLLALIAGVQVFLLKVIPYSYHRDTVVKRIPHYMLKLFFKLVLKISMSLCK
jgi:hypothetical protein